MTAGHRADAAMAAVAAALLLSLAAIVAATAGAAAPAADGDTLSGPFAFPISTARVETTPMAAALRIPGKVVPAPLGEARVIAPAPGAVIYPPNPPRIGQTVKKGDALADFAYLFEVHDAVHLLNQRWPVLQSLLKAQRDQVAAHVEYERAQALANAPAGTEYERVHALVGAEAVARAEARWKAAQADVDAWIKRLELYDKQIQTSEPTRQTLVSPITGVIADTRFTQGQLVHEADPLFTIANLSEVWIEGTVSVADADSIKRTDTATVFLPGVVIAPRQARRQSVVPLVEGETRMVKLQYSVPNADRLLRFNMSVDLFVEQRDRGAAAPALTVPRAAVLTREQRAFVFVKVGADKYARREVRVRGENARMIAIDAVAAGDQVVVEGNRQLWSILEEGAGPATQAHVR
jgi:RND family efflux transporter MFP subunit